MWNLSARVQHLFLVRFSWVCRNLESLFHSKILFVLHLGRLLILLSSIHPFWFHFFFVSSFRILIDSSWFELTRLSKNRPNKLRLSIVWLMMLVLSSICPKPLLLCRCCAWFNVSSVTFSVSYQIDP